MQVFTVIALLIAILAVTFALQNPGSVVIKFLAWEFSGSLALILILTFAFGFLASLLISSAKVIKKKLHQRTEEEKGEGEKNEGVKS